MTDQPHRFRVIEGGERPKPHRARKRGQAEKLLCHVCEADIGVGTATTMDVKLGRFIRDGKPEGGTKAIICAHCLGRGKVTILV